MTIQRPLRFFFAFVLFSISTAAFADEIGINVGAEKFRWREFDSGDRLLEEKGERFHVGGEWRRELSSNLLLEVKGSLYFGNVDYNGQTQDGVPAKTDTHYRGIEVGANVAQRFGDTSGGVEIFGGGGVDEWRRDVKDTTDAMGRQVSGAIEDWTTFYLAAGGGGYWTGSGVRIWARAGVKYPILTLEVPDSFDVVLEPKGRLSPFARLTIDFLRDSGRPLWGLGFYFDGYRWNKSPKEEDSPFIIFQPKSSQDVLGVYATFYLR